MSLRYSRRIKLGDGVSLNLGKRSASVLIGGKSGRITVGSRGSRATAHIPGTHASYSTRLGQHGRQGASERRWLRIGRLRGARSDRLVPVASGRHRVSAVIGYAALRRHFNKYAMK
jgi:Protein of unknown function (DUF4236)